MQIFEEAGPAAGCDQHRPRQRRGRGRAVDHPSRREGGDLHGLKETGIHVATQGAADAQANPPRAGRQERHHRDGRRRSGQRRRRHPLERVRHQRSALHCGQPGDRARAGVRRAGEAAGGASRGPADRKRAGSRDRRRPADQPGGAGQGAPLHRHRPRRRCQHPHRWGALDGRVQMATTTTRPSTATSSATCGSPPRRSSARRPR